MLVFILVFNDSWAYKIKISAFRLFEFLKGKLILCWGLLHDILRLTEEFSFIVSGELNVVFMNWIPHSSSSTAKSLFLILWYVLRNWIRLTQMRFSYWLIAAFFASRPTSYIIKITFITVSEAQFRDGVFSSYQGLCECPWAKRIQQFLAWFSTSLARTSLFLDIT